MYILKLLLTAGTNLSKYKRGWNEQTRGVLLFTIKHDSNDANDTTYF